MPDNKKLECGQGQIYIYLRSDCAWEAKSIQA